jgi:hypothetical protein
VRGIKEAVARGAGVINISSSNPAKDVDTKQAGVLDQAITEAFDAGVVVVVAAGNEGKGDPAVPGNLTKVINVGSASGEGTRDPFSNYGPWLDMMSPGNSLVLPAPKAVCSTGYGNATGTSFSAPAVAGAAALIGGSRPELSMQQLAELLRTGATKDLYTAGRDNDSGFGLLEVASGLTEKAPTKQPTEVDDDVHWLKKDPKKHPTLLRSSRKVSLKSGVTAGKDPQDVFPVRLKRGELLTATATTNSGLMLVSLYSPKTGSFSIGDGSTSSLLRDSGGFTTRPQVSFRARSTGTYYLSVAAPDPPDPSDPNTADDESLTKPIGYTFSVRKSAAKKSTKKKTKK